MPWYRGREERLIKLQSSSKDNQIRTAHLQAFFNDEVVCESHLPLGIVVPRVRGKQDAKASKENAALKLIWFKQIFPVMHLIWSG